MPPSAVGRRPPVDWGHIVARRSRQANNPVVKTFYDTRLVDRSTPINRLTFGALDFETTGLDPEKDAIISIGLVPFDLRRIYCRLARSWKIRPAQSLSAESVAVHGLTHDDLATGGELAAGITSLLGAVGEMVIVVHFREIERRFLDAAALSCFGESLQFPLIDTMEIEARVHRQRVFSLKRLLGRSTPPSLRLADSRQRYGLPSYRPHHALTDAIATAELLQAQIAHHFSDTMPVSSLWV